MNFRNLYIYTMLGVACIGTSHAYNFTKFLCSGDPFPGGGKVDSLTYPMLSNGAMVLSAVCDLPDESAQIVGSSLGGTTDVLFGTNTPIPGGTGNFETFSHTAFWNGKLLFSATGSGDQSGIYTGMPGVLKKIADTNTLVPDANGATFVKFNPGGYQMGINSVGNVAFTGMTYAENGPLTGVYRSSGNTLTRVADTTQYVPGSTTLFERLSNPTLTSTSTVFLGTGGSDSSTVGGLYESDFATGTLSPVALVGQMDPEGKIFELFSAPLAGGDRVAFVAELSDGSRGLYYSENGTLHALITTGMVIPGTDALTANIVPTFSLNENGDIVFHLIDYNANPYIVAWLDGEFSLVADINTTFDGRVPINSPDALGVGSYRFSGNQFAIYAKTGPDLAGVYTTTLGTYTTAVPEPGTVALLGLGGIVGLLALRRRSC